MGVLRECFLSLTLFPPMLPYITTTDSYDPSDYDPLCQMLSVSMFSEATSFRLWLSASNMASLSAVTRSGPISRQFRLL